MQVDLSSVVEEIGRVNDGVESTRWQVAQLIAGAYAELPLYTIGLTAGLSERLRKSPDTIRDMAKAEDLRARLKVPPALSVSHFVVLSHLVTRYDIPDDTCREWLDHAQSCNLSVRDLRRDITTALTQDAKEAWMRKLRRGSETFRQLLADAESINLPEDNREALKVIVAMVGDLLSSL